MTPLQVYTLTPLSGDRGKQVVAGYADAMSVARMIARRGHTVIVRNEARMLTWTVAPHGAER